MIMGKAKFSGLMLSVTLKAMTLLISLSLSACVIYPHTVPVNPSVEGNLVSVESGLPVNGAELTLNIGSDMSRTYRTSSDANGRFAFAAHSDFRLIALLADAPSCWTTLTVSAPGYRTRHCGWISRHWCSTAPLNLQYLSLLSEQAQVTPEMDVEDFHNCIASATGMNN